MSFFNSSAKQWGAFFLLLFLIVFAAALQPRLTTDTQPAAVTLSQERVDALRALFESLRVDPVTIQQLLRYIHVTSRSNAPQQATGQVATTTRTLIQTTVASTTPSVTCPDLRRTLFIGRRGEDVKQLQLFLKQLGYFTYPHLTTYFGPATQKALRQYQCEHMNICSGSEWGAGYGLLGPRTRESIRAFCTKDDAQGAFRFPLSVGTETVTKRIAFTIASQSGAGADVPQESGCTIGNVTLTEGESIIAYATPVSFNCAAKAQERACKNGRLTGDSAYRYTQCHMPGTGAGGGGGVAGGGSEVVRYQWKVEEWGLCESGIQKGKASCFDPKTGERVPNRLCDAAKKPSTQRACYPQKEVVYTMLNALHAMIFGTSLARNDATVAHVFTQIKNNAALFDKYNPYFDSTTHFILRRFYNWLFFDPRSKTRHGILVGAGSLSNTAFLDKMYAIILERKPTAQEINEALSLLQKGYSRLEVARRVLMSDESRKKHASLFENQYLKDPLAFEGVGPFIGRSMAQRVEPFAPDTRLVGAYIYRWYDYESKTHVCIPESLVAPERKSWVKEWLILDDGQRCAVVLVHRPVSYTNPLFSNKSKEYWKKQFRDMHAAGVDIAIFAGDFGLPYMYPIENRMKYYEPINQALDELYHEGIKIKVSYIHEPLSWRHSTNGNAMFDYIDLQYTDVREFIYQQARDFYSNINPKHWAVIDGKVPVYTWRPFDYVKNANDSFKHYFDQRFKEDFGIAANIMFGDAAYVINGRYTEHPWSGVSKQYRYAWGAVLSPDAAWVRNNIAQLSAGFDNSLSAVKLRDPNAKPLVVPREGGAFYKKGWDTVYANPQVNLVLIETWDELHEGRGISETREFGRKYIDATRSYVNKWRSMNIEKQAVYAAYKAILKRYPDPGGLQTYEAAIKSGKMSLIEMMWTLFNSPEFANRFIGGGKRLNDLSNQEYVTLVYQTLLLRDPDPGGLNHYVAKLDAGERTRYEVFDIVLNSGEFADKHPFYPYLKTHYRYLIR